MKDCEFPHPVDCGIEAVLIQITQTQTFKHRRLRQKFV